MPRRVAIRQREFLLAAKYPRFRTACYLCPREFMRRASIVLGTVLVSCALVSGQALFPKPVKYLGDSEFVATATNPLSFQTLGPNWVEGREFNTPAGIALDTSVSPPILYVADSGNNRVLGFRYNTQLVAGSVADIVIGQVDFFSNQAQNPASGGRQTGLNNPTGLAVDSAGNLYVADSGNNRILRFPQPFSAANSFQFPSMVIGQKSYSTSTANLNGIGASTLAISTSGLGRTGIAIDPSGNLWVADSGNNRVLRFPAAVLSAGASFPAADTVLGQANFTTSTGPSVSVASRSTLTGLASPNGIAFDSAGNLYVTDHLYRLVLYKAPLVTGQAGYQVVGVDPNTTNVTTPTQLALNSPTGVFVAGGTPVIADTSNNRALVFPLISQWPLPGISPTASAVIGQPSYTVNQANQGNVDASSSTLSGPVDIAASSTEVYVVDQGNNRVLVYSISATGSISTTATRVIGQLDFPYSGKNLVDGKGYAFPGGYPAGAILDNSVSPARLYVADTLNNRVLGYSNFNNAKNGLPPDIVIGQPDMYRNAINYPSGNAATPNATGLSAPTCIALDAAGNLYVADTNNSRVVRFPAPFASGVKALEPADIVIGQSSFTSTITDPTSVTMSAPVGLAFTSGALSTSATSAGWLVVADAAQNRVLLFPKPFTTGMSATVVLGQFNMIAGASGTTATALSSPRGLAVDPQDHVMVVDTTNKRIQIFDQAQNLSNGAQPLVSLNTLLTTPTQISAGAAGDFWVADSGANRLLHYPAVANLAQTSDAPDTALGAVGPLSAFVDPVSNNLLITDALNRVLFFAPQVSLTNAATYSTRALSAGTVAALFPTVTTNIIAKGTGPAPANQFPLPVTLNDTQVTVNGTPIPLLYVSPGQDNVILPQGLATSGTADLQVLKASTGQILAGAEIGLATASPGLFSADASGAGQVLAVNLQDSTINSSAHPVVRGQYVILYGTGVGPVPNPPADGTAASGQAASDFPEVLIASSGSSTSSTGTVTTLPAFIPANVTYSGLAPGFAGLWQINVQIPQNAQSGSAVVIKVYEKDIPNLDQTSTLTTTLAVN